MILGIDVSTSITGFAVYSLDGEFKLSGAVEMKNKNKFKNIYEKAAAIEDFLLKIKINYNITRIFIEEKLLGFAAGKSSPKVMAKLTEFNGMVSLLTHQLFQLVPTHVNPSSARKQAGIKITRGTKAKEQVVKYLLDKCPEFVVEYTPKGNIRPKYYDIADAIVIAKAGYNQIRKGSIKNERGENGKDRLL